MRGYEFPVVGGLLAILVGCAACSGSGDDTWLPGAVAHTGQVQFGLSKEPAIEVDTVSIEVTAPDDSTSSYEIDIAGTEAASIGLGGLSPGTYSVTFSATTRRGAPCGGSAEFEIEPDVDTRVHVEIVCDIE